MVVILWLDALSSGCHFVIILFPFFWDIFKWSFVDRKAARTIYCTPEAFYQGKVYEYPSLG